MVGAEDEQAQHGKTLAQRKVFDGKVHAVFCLHGPQPPEYVCAFKFRLRNGGRHELAQIELLQCVAFKDFAKSLDECFFQDVARAHAIASADPADERVGNGHHLSAVQVEERNFLPLQAVGLNALCGQGGRRKFLHLLHNFFLGRPSEIRFVGEEAASRPFRCGIGVNDDAVLVTLHKLRVAACQGVVLRHAFAVGADGEVVCACDRYAARAAQPPIA